MGIPNSGSIVPTSLRVAIDGGYLSWAYGGMGSKSWPSVRHLYSKKSRALICMDSSVSARKEFYPLYKSHRKARRDDRPQIFEKVKTFQEYLREDPSMWKFEAEGLEADDLVAILGKTIPIIGGDKDLLQVPGISLSRITGEVLSPLNFIKRQSQTIQRSARGTPQEILLLLSLLGDSSDDIPRLVSRGGLNTVALILTETNPWLLAYELYGQALLTNLYLAILPGPWCYDPVPSPKELFDLLVMNQLSELVLRYELQELKEYSYASD